MVKMKQLPHREPECEGFGGLGLMACRNTQLYGLHGLTRDTVSYLMYCFCYCTGPCFCMSQQKYRVLFSLQPHAGLRALANCILETTATPPTRSYAETLKLQDSWITSLTCLVFPTQFLFCAYSLCFSWGAPRFGGRFGANPLVL
jgi:hypothetical protein